MLMHRKLRIVLILLAGLALSCAVCWKMRRGEEVPSAPPAEPCCTLLRPVSATLEDGVPCRAAEKLAENLLCLGNARYQLLAGLLESVHDAASADAAASRCRVLLAEIAAVNRALAACRLNSAAVGLLESLTQEYMQQVERYAGERNRLLSLQPVAYGSAPLARALDAFAPAQPVELDAQELFADTCELLSWVGDVASCVCGADDAVSLGNKQAGLLETRISRVAALVIRWGSLCPNPGEERRVLNVMPAEQREKLEIGTQHLVYLDQVYPVYGESAALREWCMTLACVLPPLHAVLKDSWEQAPTGRMGRLRRIAELYNQLIEVIVDRTDEKIAYSEGEKRYKEVLYLQMREREFLNLRTTASCCMMALLRNRMEILLDVCVDEQRKTSDEGFAQLLRDIKEDTYRSFVFYGGKWVEEVADDEDSEQASELEVDAESAAVLKILQILKEMQRLEEESESED